MKKLINFIIESDFGMFKKPDVNDPVYFTFNIIPKPTLLGILGAIIGLRGYSQMSSGDIYPEFYDKLQDLKVGIIPFGNKGVFQKRVIKYNNTIGYANKDGVLNILEQTLIMPKYQIYILLDLSNEVHKKLDRYLSTQPIEYEYIPYMGKNEFRLTINSVKSYDSEKFSIFKPINDFAINSLFPNIGNETLKNSEAKRSPFDLSMSETYFYYFERLPIAFDELNQYRYENFSYTNAKFSKDADFTRKLNLINIRDKVICLY